MAKDKFIPLDSYREYPPEEMADRAAAFRADMLRRRSVRSFSSRPVAREVIEDCLLAAGSAPSGANMQPAPEEWLGAISDLGTDWQKPFLETAPYLIVIFAQRYGLSTDGRKIKHYYVRDSVGIATGILIAAIHNAGLVSLPYTPSRMGFLNRILERPENERASMVLVVGYPEEGATVPELRKKTLDETTTFV